MMMASERTKAIQKSKMEISTILPKSASKISPSVTRRAPIASERAKNTPTTVSTGSFVLFSTSQIKNMPTTRKTTEPHRIFKLNMSAMAIPGRATCESASPTRAILRKSANEPSSPPAAAIKLRQSEYKLKKVQRPYFNADDDKKLIPDRKVWKALPALILPAARQNKSALYSNIKLESRIYRPPSDHAKS